MMTNKSTTITIAIDAMGGDFGPKVTVPATIDFLRQTKGYNIILVGLIDEINAEIEKHKGLDLVQQGLISLQAASEVVGMEESPAMALKKKKDSSMRVAINQVKENQAHACVSAGNTGALMATSRFVLKMIKGIDRPAICTILPSKNPLQPVRMLDLGANVDSTPEMLLQFALMGSALTEIVENKSNPTLGLLNVGSEEIKGSDLVKKTATLLSESSLNYAGYIEGDEIYSNKVDVVVCDGFEGNISLKTSEGVASLILETLRDEFNRNIFTKIAAIMSMPILKRLKKRLDPGSFNGATFIGLNGIVVKSHGGASRSAFVHAITEAGRQARLDVTVQISDKISKILT